MILTQSDGIHQGLISGIEPQEEITVRTIPRDGPGSIDNIGLPKEKMVGGLWSLNKQEIHINCLELLAASLAIQTFAKEKRNIYIIRYLYLLNSLFCDPLYIQTCCQV